MSCNYADGLSPYLNKGKLGLPEVQDSPEEVSEKIKTLAAWVKEARHVVVHTGAGCSTSAGIPDFRGPNGVWTLENKGQKPEINVSFEAATPTSAHMILKSFLDRGIVKYIVTQNIDGLHLRSGVKRCQMSELHGNMFVARCSYCERYIAQSSSLPTVGQKKIGLDCPVMKAGGRRCRGKLHDTLLDWEHNLPPLELQMAEIHSRLADLSICVGTTLQIIPAGNLPLLVKKKPEGRLVIINLQPTKHDDKASLIIHEKIDLVMRVIARLFDVEALPYSTGIDPTRSMKGSKEEFLDWTISSSAITMLKKLEADFKSTKKTRPVKRKPTPNGLICSTDFLSSDFNSSANKLTKSEVVDEHRSSISPATNLGTRN